MKTIRLIFFLLFLGMLNYSCTKEDFVPVSSLDSILVDAGQNKNLKCVIVYKDSLIVVEKFYHNGAPNATHDVRSVTKSVMSTLMGIAIDKGIIPSENEKIGNYLEPYFSTIDSAKATITIHDLLSMSSGISGDELANVDEYNNWVTSPNQIAYTLNRTTNSKPGQKFIYNSGAAHLLSAVLTNASGLSTIDFARQYLFKPLGIGDHAWQTDKQGLYNGGAGLQLTPYEMVKLGQLYLNKGICNGVRVVSGDWIEKATSFKISTVGIEPFTTGYGFFWWLGKVNNHAYFFANGYGGQFIVVVPDIRLIVVTTNTWSGVEGSVANQQWYSTLDMIINKIIPLYY